MRYVGRWAQCPASMIARSFLARPSSSPRAVAMAVLNSGRAQPAFSHRTRTHASGRSSAMALAMAGIA
eukprot:2738127-Lingulodinium_polyedra.AAC.1